MSAPAPFRPTHRHRKGGLYEFLGHARHSETGEDLAVYRDAVGGWWARPRAMFDDGRFTPLDELDRAIHAADAKRSAE